jgi:endonuclease YncB( thermonuclease family)
VSRAFCIVSIAFRRRSRRWLAALALAAPLAAGAETLNGFVVGVLDGETVMLRDEAGRQHRVRLLGLDAPGKREPYGDLARHNLSRIAFQQPARAECPQREGKARLACRVWVPPADCPGCGNTLDVGLAQISAGLARWRSADERLLSPDAAGRYHSGEEEARARGRGLWATAR